MVINSLRESNEFYCHIAKIINYGFLCNSQIEKIKRRNILEENCKYSLKYPIFVKERYYKCYRLSKTDVIGGTSSNNLNKCHLWKIFVYDRRIINTSHWNCHIVIYRQ